MSDFKFKDIGRVGTISVQEMLSKDKVYVRISKLYQNAEGAWLPSSKGISIPMDQIIPVRDFINKFISEHPELEDTKDSDLVEDLGLIE